MQFTMRRMDPTQTISTASVFPTWGKPGKEKAWNIRWSIPMWIMYLSDMVDMRVLEGECNSHISGTPWYRLHHDRFFAANELKAMLAHIVLSYDVKFEDEGVRPPNQWFSVNCVPNMAAKVMFKRRQLVWNSWDMLRFSVVNINIITWF